MLSRSRRPLRRLAAMAAFVAGAGLAPTIARADAPTPALPYLVQGNESAASTDGAASLLFNPALTGLRYPAELLLSYASAGSRQEIDDALLTLGGFGVRATRVRDVAQFYGVSFAAGDPRAVRVGWSPEWHVNSRTNDRMLDHRVGLLTRPAPWMSLGFVTDHVFQPELDGVRLGRTYTLAAGLRPFALSRSVAHSLGTRFTLTGDFIVPEDGEWEQTRVRVGGELEALPGIVLRGAAEDHGGYHFGVTVRGPRSSWTTRGSQHEGSAREYVAHSLSIHSGEERPAIVARSDRRIATVRIAGRLADENLAGLSLFGSDPTTPSGPIHRQLERALEDPLTAGVLLELQGVAGMAQLEELRPRVADLRLAGKPVVAFLEYGGGRGDLYLASACDRTVATEEAMFARLGLRAERRSYRRLFADWGLRVDRSSRGDFKSAYRNWSTDSTPPADTTSIREQLDASQAMFVRAVTESRKLDAAQLMPLLDGRQWPPTELQRAGVIDSVGYREDALRIAGTLAGLGPKPHTANLADLAPARRAWHVPTRIAIVYAGGEIESGRTGSDLLSGATLGSETLTHQLEEAFHRGDVKAVVLRIESPGGSGLASNLIDHAVQRLKRETGKPLIVSMGSVAASGGYYIAAHADRIYADRYTQTGSIGVFILKPSLEGWYAKHGVRQEDFDRGAYMKGWSYARDWDAATQAAADSSIERYYRGFVAKVADGRHLPFDDVERAAQGRVYFGEAALAAKLIDGLGGLDAAVAEARRRAGVPFGERIEPVEFRRPRAGLIERVLSSAITQAWERSMRMVDPVGVQFMDDEVPVE